MQFYILQFFVLTVSQYGEASIRKINSYCVYQMSYRNHLDMNIIFRIHVWIIDMHLNYSEIASVKQSSHVQLVQLSGIIRYCASLKIPENQKSTNFDS